MVDFLACIILADASESVVSMSISNSGKHSYQLFNYDAKKEICCKKMHNLWKPIFVLWQCLYNLSYINMFLNYLKARILAYLLLMQVSRKGKDKSYA
jgi:hypothetical protein